jgi:hypothetical protein
MYIKKNYEFIINLLKFTMGQQTTNNAFHWDRYKNKILCFEYFSIIQNENRKKTTAIIKQRTE